MTGLSYWLPFLVPLTSLLAGVVIFFVAEENRPLRSTLNIASAVLKLFLVGCLLVGVAAGQTFEFRFALAGDFDFVLRADSLSLLFVSLSALLWLVTTVYAIGYLENGPNRSRFFGFFSLCVSATTGIALAGNPLTFLIMYEFLTLTTYPLVVHRGTDESLRAGRFYLAYTLGGGALLFVALVWLHVMAGPVDFAERGVLANLATSNPDALRVLFYMMMAALGVKAALLPLHGWLPRAMVAPAPVSALLHAVAVVKAGAFGMVRVVYDLFGIDTCVALDVLTPLAIAAGITILYGSLRAVFQDDLKRRLAYSTVSQVSYIILGISIMGPAATIGGVVHLVHQGLMKITLFFCAGNLAETRHIHKVSEMNGVGSKMPWTMAAFSLAALGMIGVPPMAGFISKWYLAIGALEAGRTWVLPVLVLSSLLNAVYFLPILYRAWFLAPPEGAGDNQRTIAQPYLLWPALITCVLALCAGLFAGTDFSPLAWVKLITAREYGL